MQDYYQTNRPDDDTLVLLPSLHEVVGIVRNGKDVWRLLPNLLVSVLVDVLQVVDGEQGVWVDGHQDGARECLRGIVWGMGDGGRGEGETNSFHNFIPNCYGRVNWYIIINWVH